MKVIDKDLEKKIEKLTSIYGYDPDHRDIPLIQKMIDYSENYLHKLEVQGIPDPFMNLLQYDKDKHDPQKFYRFLAELLGLLQGGYIEEAYFKHCHAKLREKI